MARTVLIDRPPRHPLIRAFEAFFRVEASGGILLLACAVIALIWANSPFGDAYAALWATVITIGAEQFAISKPLLLWINDGLMAIFFFVVGLEIKREVLVGELSSAKQAALPLAGAVGGVALPAAFYAVLNAGTPEISGWGVPMATDIAFALGVMALLGSRVPLALKIFLTALAIVDDLAAVLVIAVFYTADVSWAALASGAVIVAGLIGMNRLNAYRPLPYILLGVALWVAVLMSGVHATVAGVVLAMTIPARRRIDAPQFLERGRRLMDIFAGDAVGEAGSLQAKPTPRQLDVIHTMELSCQEVESPLQRLEHSLHPWVAFFIMPVFALANAGVVLGGDMLAAAFGSTVTLGIILGLVLGKQIGVTVFAWLAVRLGWAAMPTGVTWRQLYGVAWLTGIGFTMSLFIAGLAFVDPAVLDSAKVGIITASLISGIGGWLLLQRSRPAGEVIDETA